MRADHFVDDNLVLGEQNRCPLIPFRERCKAAGLTTREVLAEIRSRHGNGCSNPSNYVASPWIKECRMTMPDGSRPRAFMGFAFKDSPVRLPPFVEKIWSHLPYKGPVSGFPVAATAQQLAGACKSGRVVMTRRGRNIHIVREIDSEYDDVLKKAKRQRYERKKRRDIREQWQPTQMGLTPFLTAIWPHLPYKGPISDFPLPISVHQLAAACKSRCVAMVRRNDDIYIARYIDSCYEDLWKLGKDRRAWNGPNCIDREERDELWQEYLAEFPHPNPVITKGPAASSVLFFSDVHSASGTLSA